MTQTDALGKEIKKRKKKSGTCFFETLVSGHFTRVKWGESDIRLTSVPRALGWWSDTAGLRTAAEMGISPGAKHANRSGTVPASSVRTGHRASSQSDWFWSLLIGAGFESTA